MGSLHFWSLYQRSQTEKGKSDLVALRGESAYTALPALELGALTFN